MTIIKQVHKRGWEIFVERAKEDLKKLDPDSQEWQQLHDGIERVEEALAELENNDNQKGGN